MSGRLPYVTRKYYPHMTGEDGAIWNRFVEKYPQRFDSVDYDFRVGQGTELAGDIDDNYVRMAKMLSQKRIDVVGWNGDYPTIIEVKLRVGLSTLGQILGYQKLFGKEFPHFSFPELLVVCQYIGQDDVDVLTSYRVPVEVV